MENKKQIDIDEAWKKGLISWNNPSIPRVITPKSKDEINALGKVGDALKKELAFMKYPEFQTYQNLEKITETFPEDTQRGLEAINKHEIGHRFCPYYSITLILLNHVASKALKNKKKSIDLKTASSIAVNLYTDMCDNTKLVRQGDEDIIWAYKQISKKLDNPSWRVYGRSMELSWDKQILPEGVQLSETEQKAAEKLKKLFEGNYFDRTRWKRGCEEYTDIIGDFFSEEENNKKGKSKSGKSSDKLKGKSETSNEGKDGKSQDKDDKIGTGFDDITKNIPETIDDKTAQELAKRVAEIGSNGLPTNSSGLEEFKDIMAGFGEGNPTQASIYFYDMLSKSYDVMFSTQPFGRPRINPFQPVKWNQGMGADKLDADYSAQVGGRIIPGVNTYMWNTRKREINGGLEEVVPNLDIYLDSSGSMPNPINQISLPVLAEFVIAKKAHKKGAKIRSTNFSGDQQYKSQDFTDNLQSIFENAVIHYNGGTVFPIKALLEGNDPRQVIVITDTFLGNMEETADAISDMKRQNKSNKVAIYALHPVINADLLRGAGADVIHGTTTDIFKKVIGKSVEVYDRT